MLLEIAEPAPPVLQERIRKPKSGAKRTTPIKPKAPKLKLGKPKVQPAVRGKRGKTDPRAAEKPAGMSRTTWWRVRKGKSPGFGKKYHQRVIKTLSGKARRLPEDPAERDELLRNIEYEAKQWYRKHKVPADISWEDIYQEMLIGWLEGKSLATGAARVAPSKPRKRTELEKPMGLVYGQEESAYLETLALQAVRLFYEAYDPESGEWLDPADLDPEAEDRREMGDLGVHVPPGQSVSSVRAGDVTLKERRQLLLLVRETPLHIGHLRNMKRLAEMGAVIMPPVPAFYYKPKTIPDIIDYTVGKVLDIFDITHNLFTRWVGVQNKD